jgi:prevent-host-death family protein
MERIVSASTARDRISEILDQAERGVSTLIVRHSRVIAAVVPAAEHGADQIFIALMREVGETIELSSDPEVITAVVHAKEQIKEGNIIFHD